MKPSDRDAISPMLRQVELSRKQAIHLAGQPLEFAYFIESGTASSFSSVNGQLDGELGICGFEGMTGTPLLFGDRYAASTCVASSTTSGHRIAAHDLIDFLRSRPTLLAFLMRLARARHIQSSSTAAANLQGSMEQRVARRLLMALDRTRQKHLAITHQDLSTMMSTGLPNTTNAIHKLEGERLVKATRGTIEVADRQRLEVLVGGFYGPAELAYLRLLGVDFRLCLRTSVRSSGR